MRVRLFAFAAALSAACTAATLSRPPDGALERAIVFREAADDGWHGVSDPDPFAAEVARVLDPAWVDVESRIEVLPRADALRAAAAAAGADPAAASLRLEAWLERPGTDPIALHLPGYDALDARVLASAPAPLAADPPPAALDLTRTLAAVGDRVAVRGTLLDSGGIPLGETFEARFRLRQLGWHSSYHPSVVLARPFDPLPAEAEFRFTPGIAWLHAYTPRQDEQGALAGWLRATSASIGPHALLLQFDSEDEVEIGLGVTAGFWDGVLQLGWGFNLMADGGQDRQYFYLGSSMIPLAQAAQRSFGAFGGL